MYLLSYVSVNIFCDDLDEVKVSGNIQELASYMISFITVANRLNSDISQICNQSSRIFILVRSDLLHVLNNYSSNINKILSDSTITLDWRRVKLENGQKLNILLDLIATKIKKSTPSLESKTNNQVVRMFFPKKIGKDSMNNYINKYTMGKPRDIVLMLNCIVELYGDKESFEDIDFKGTKDFYAKKMIGEIRNEMNLLYDDTIKNECFNVLKNMNKYIFAYSDVVDYYQDNKELGLSPEEFCNICYSYGIIGNKITRHEGNSAFVWVYDERHPENPNINEQFVIHYSIASYVLGHSNYE